MALHGTDAKAESGSTLYIPEQDSASSRFRLKPSCSGGLMALHGTDAKAESGSTLYILGRRVSPELAPARSRRRFRTAPGQFGVDGGHDQPRRQPMQGQGVGGQGTADRNGGD